MKGNDVKSGKGFSFTVALLIALVSGIFFSGCRTVLNIQRDVFVHAAGDITHEGLLALEETIIRLDGEGAGMEEILAARAQLNALQGTVADPGFEGVLAAWSGRLFLMEGRVTDARRELTRSHSLSPYNMPSLVLSFRLERDLLMRLAMIDSSIEIEGAQGELLAERGRALFYLNRFFESVAAFDSAFILLSARPFYEQAYRDFRDRAWELRNLDTGADDRTVAIARQGEMSWRDLIEITRNETDLLRFVTAGRDWPVETIFSQLVDRAFIPPTQDASRLEWPSSRPASSDIVYRSGAAWFLWHLHAENRANRGLLTQFSSRFANMPNPRSPVDDIDISSPFIDSILGSVQSDFMSLPDGRNFAPNEPVSGADYLVMVRRL
ncbi:MAG: S-layer homology domain-containing protein [Treponema sp.]|jgi:tetratricopeptide (TPR) repeat protein|nr:S-layer homology domain-containing protein [Treponema sp.]